MRKNGLYANRGKTTCDNLLMEAMHKQPRGRTNPFPYLGYIVYDLWQVPPNEPYGNLIKPLHFTEVNRIPKIICE